MTKEEYKDKLDELREKVHKVWLDSFDIADYESAWKYYTNHPDVKEFEKLWREYKLIMDYELEDIPSYGTLMPFDEFMKCCKYGPIFTDDDGSGYYATEDKMSSIPIAPSDIMADIYRNDFAYVMWFNK